MIQLPEAVRYPQSLWHSCVKAPLTPLSRRCVLNSAGSEGLQSVGMPLAATPHSQRRAQMSPISWIQNPQFAGSGSV